MENVLNLNVKNYNGISTASDEGHPSQIRLNVSNLKGGHVEIFEGCEYKKSLAISKSPETIILEPEGIIRFRCIESNGNIHPFINLVEDDKEVNSYIQLDKKTNCVFLYSKVEGVITLFALEDENAFVIGENALIL